MRIERHLFGSFDGYQTIAASPGIRPDEAAELSEFGFGQPSDQATLDGLAHRLCVLGRRLRSGRSALTRAFPGRPDDAGRPTVELRTMVLEPADFLIVRHDLRGFFERPDHWDEKAFRDGTAASISAGGMKLPPSRDAWYLVDSWMRLKGRRDVVLRLSDDARSHDAILSAVGSVDPEDAVDLRWGLHLFSTSAAVDACTLASSASLSARRQVVDLPLDQNRWRHPHLESLAAKQLPMGPFRALENPEADLLQLEAAAPRAGMPSVRHRSSVPETRDRKPLLVAGIAGVLLLAVIMVLMLLPSRSPAPTTPETTLASAVGEDTASDASSPSEGSGGDRESARIDVDHADGVGMTDGSNTEDSSASKSTESTADRSADATSVAAKPQDPGSGPVVDPNGGMLGFGDQTVATTPDAGSSEPASDPASEPASRPAEDRSNDSARSERIAEGVEFEFGDDSEEGGVDEDADAEEGDESTRKNDQYAIQSMIEAIEEKNIELQDAVGYAIANAPGESRRGDMRSDDRKSEAEDAKARKEWKLRVEEYSISALKVIDELVELYDQLRDRARLEGGDQEYWGEAACRFLKGFDGEGTAWYMSVSIIIDNASGEITNEKELIDLLVQQVEDPKCLYQCRLEENRGRFFLKDINQCWEMSHEHAQKLLRRFDEKSTGPKLKPKDLDKLKEFVSRRGKPPGGTLWTQLQILPYDPPSKPGGENVYSSLFQWVKYWHRIWEEVEKKVKKESEPS